MLGIVKWFDAKKGYGFISREDGPAEPADVFVHHTGIVGDGFKVLYENDKVEFEVESDKKGLRAINVKVVK